MSTAPMREATRRGSARALIMERGYRAGESKMNGDEYLERVRKLLPAVRERAALTERTRRLPDESWTDFQRAGLLRALQPARWGGFELHPSAFYRAVTEVSAACPSTGWVLGVLGVHSWQIAAFPERAQREI
jgi:3-hydroxy-9,10-secoandrosta-1,3,5(10)-triene-9,17-dione monooxygenase